MSFGLGLKIRAECTDHGAVRDETDERVRREHGERDDEDVPKRLEVVRVEAGVNDEEEDGRDLGRAGEGVFDGRVLGQELGREVVGREVFVVRGEGVALETQGADPELCADVELTAEREQGRWDGCSRGRRRRGSNSVSSGSHEIMNSNQKEPGWERACTVMPAVASACAGALLELSPPTRSDWTGPLRPRARSER